MMPLSNLMLLQRKKRGVRFIKQVNRTREFSRNPICHGTRRGSRINNDAVDIPCSNGDELGVSFCRGSTASRLVMGERECAVSQCCHRLLEDSANTLTSC